MDKYNQRFLDLVSELSDDDSIQLGNDYSYTVKSLKSLGCVCVSDDPYIVNIGDNIFLIGYFGVSNDQGSLSWVCEDCVSRITFDWSIFNASGYQFTKGYFHKLSGDNHIESDNKIYKYEEPDIYDFNY